MKLFCLFLIALAAFAEDAAVPITQEPHHKLVLQNDYTRVFDVTVPAKQSTLLHQHDRDYLSVILATADVQNAVVGRPVTTGHAGKGEVRFSIAPVTHKLTVTGDAPYHTIAIEVLKKKEQPAKEQPSERGLDVGHGGLTDLVVDNAEVRVQDVQIAAGGMLHKHAHKYPFLVIALSDAELLTCRRENPRPR
jgi:quercetin dioxygenase-like cupin family protein